MRKRYLTLDEAALVLLVTPPTLARWAQEGRVPAYKTPGGHWRFYEPDLLLALRSPREAGQERDDG